MPINRYLLKKEKAFENSMNREFKKAQKEIEKFLIKQDTQKDFTSDLEEILDKINISIAVLLAKKAKPVIIKWTKETQKINPSFWIDFNLRNDPAVRYLDNLINIHSSNVIQWSIWHTTYTRVKKLIRKWVNDWLSYTEVAKNITKLDWLVFSKSRAKMMAVSELWTAYEMWKYLPMQDLKAQWEVVMKAWQTVEDERVRPDHAQNEADWYIWLDIPFSWTGTQIAPFSFNCRCATIYKVI